jgi:dTDP-4-dehydrorhamnose 3,5-epimerase
MTIKYKKDDEITGLIHLYPDIFYDHRGEYISTYTSVEYQFLGAEFLEDDFSISKKNVLRGLHGDSKTKKLIQCLYGSILLAVADLREESPSYLKSHLFVLDDKSRHQVFIPEGCINGHYVLSDRCIFSYKQTEIYSGAKNQISVRYNDPWLKIPWKITDPIISERDLSAKFLKDMEEKCRKL